MHHPRPTPMAPPTTIAPTIGAAATIAPPTVVPIALAPDAIALIPEATVEPAEVIAVPAVVKPIADAAFPIPDDTEFTELENALTALLLTFVIDEPIVFAPTWDSADPDAIPTVAPNVPVIAL